MLHPFLHRLVNTQINRRDPTHLVDILERQGSMRTSIKFHAVDEDTVDINRELAKIRARLLRKYNMVFIDNLDRNDRLDVNPMKLVLVDNYEDISPTNHMIPFPTPRHLQAAADKELNKLLAAGVLEKVEHPTEWCGHLLGTRKCKIFKDQEPKFTRRSKNLTNQ